MRDSDDIRQMLEDLDKRVTVLEDIHQQSDTVQQTSNDLRTFVASHEASNHFEKALLIGYFYDQIEQSGGFSVSDIEDGYLESRMKLPANPRDTLTKCENEKGWMMKTGETDGLADVRVLTDDGITYVEEVLSDGA